MSHLVAQELWTLPETRIQHDENLDFSLRSTVVKGSQWFSVGLYGSGNVNDALR
jgi:hypothetical protein